MLLTLVGQELGSSEGNAGRDDSLNAVEGGGERGRGGREEGGEGGGKAEV